MRAFVFVTLLAVGLAEPNGAGPNPFDLTHYTTGFKAFPNGAVVPKDTVSVQHAKAQHYSAKANAYASKAYMPYFAHQPAAVYAAPTQYVAQPQVVQYNAPLKMQSVVPYSAATVPYMQQHQAVQYAAFPQQHQVTSYAHNMFKREAEAESEGDSQYSLYNSQYTSPSIYNYATTPYASNAYTTSPYTHNSAYYSGLNHGGVYSSGLYNGVYNGAAYATSPYSAGVYSSHLTSPYSRLIKREADAEPEAESQWYSHRGNYGHFYGAGRPWGHSYYSTSPYSSWNRYGHGWH